MTGIKRPAEKFILPNHAGKQKAAKYMFASYDFGLFYNWCFFR